MILQHAPAGRLPDRRGFVSKREAQAGELLLVVSETDAEAVAVERLAEAIDRYGLDRLRALLDDLNRRPPPGWRDVPFDPDLDR